MNKVRNKATCVGGGVNMRALSGGLTFIIASTVGQPVIGVEPLTAIPIESKTTGSIRSMAMDFELSPTNRVDKVIGIELIRVTDESAGIRALATGEDANARTNEFFRCGAFGAKKLMLCSVDCVRTSAMFRVFWKSYSVEETLTTATVKDGRTNICVITNISLPAPGLR